MRGDGKFWDINRDEKRRAEQEIEKACQSQLVIQPWFSVNLRALSNNRYFYIVAIRSLVSLLRSRLN